MFPFRSSSTEAGVRFLIIAFAAFFALALPELVGYGSAWAQTSQVDGNEPSFGSTASPSSSAVVTGLPYEAEGVLHTRRSLADGTIYTHDFSVYDARDSQGRIVREVQSEIPATGSQPSRQFVVFAVSDPAAKTVLTWTNLTKIGVLFHLPPRPPLTGRPQQKPEDAAVSLGHRVIHGLLCSGYSVQSTVPAGTMGNATPITTRHEWWINDELHVKMSETFTDPQRGERTFEFFSIKRGNPGTERFHLPSGYTFRDLPALGTAPGTKPIAAGEALDLEHAPAVTHEQAVAMLDSQDRRMQLGGAAALVKEAQAGTDAAEKDDLAYSLAKDNVGMAEAHSLASAAIASEENNCAEQSGLRTLRYQFTCQVTLAKFWDTLGFIDERQGDSASARIYIGSAFKLDPRAQYGAHLGKALEQDGDTEEAVAVYRASLQARGGEQLRETIRERLIALAGDAGKASAAAEEDLPGTGNLTGSAYFDIVYSTSSKDPTTTFVSGDEPLRALAPALPRQQEIGFLLPDAGPERVVRRVEVTCGVQADATPACRARVLGAHEARDLASHN